MLNLDLGDSSKAETMARIETVLAQSPKNIHCTFAEPNNLKTSGYRTFNSEIPKRAYLFKYCKRDNHAKLDFWQQIKWKIEKFNYIFDNLTFSDEAHFYLNGKIVYHTLIVVFGVQKSLRKFGNMRILKVNIWRAVKKSWIIGPPFFLLR